MLTYLLKTLLNLQIIGSINRSHTFAAITDNRRHSWNAMQEECEAFVILEAYVAFPAQVPTRTATALCINGF